MTPGVQIGALLAVLVWTWEPGASSRLMCRVKCGVIADEGRAAAPSRLDEVRSAWSELRFHKNIMDVDIQFVSIAERDDLGMDALIEAYMEIGTINMTAMIGPYLEPLATVTEKFGIPYFVTAPLDKVRYRPYNLLYVLPRPLDVMLVAADVARKYLWRELAVIYDMEEGVHLMEKLVQYPSLHVHSWNLPRAATRSGVRDILVTIRQLGIANIVLMTTEGHVADMVLSEALHLSLLSHHYSWILPNMNLNLDQLTQYAQTEMNLTSFRLAENFVPDLQVPAHSHRLEYITLFDSLLTIYHGVRSYYYQKGSCHWLGEDAIYSSVQRITDLGATGRMTFEDTGRRTGYVVNVYGLGDTGLYEMGVWNSSIVNVSRRLNLTGVRSRPVGGRHALGVGRVRVATVLEHPFLHYHRDHKNREGNDKYEGFCVDLLNLVARKLEFEYEIYTVPDGQIGQKYPNGSWSGVIGELVRGNVGLGVGAVAITSTREGAVDFTEPFFSVSVSAVMRRRPGPVFTLFQLFRPLSPVVWVLIVGVLVFISTALCVIDRVASPRDAQAQLSALESVWITFASLVLKAVDTSPKSVSSRILQGSVWCFALIIVVSYSANLAAYFTTARIDTTVRSVEDLVGQTRVQFGTVRNSHVSAFFRNSRLPNLQRMWHAMSAGNSSWMVNSAAEGFSRVKDSQYAFLWDFSDVRQHLHQDCDLVEVDQISRVLDYAIAVPEGVHYKDDISLAVLKLKENGQLQEFENRWWPERECSRHQDAIEAPSSLSIEDMAPVFIILGVGVVLALVASVLEHLCRSKRRHKPSKNRKIPEDGFSAKPLCDGNVPGTTQLDEPFLYQSNYATHNSKANHHCKGSKYKQTTNIF